MTDKKIDNLVQKAKATLLRRLATSSQRAADASLLPNGTPSDPNEFHSWSIKRHAEGQATGMNISGKIQTLLPEIAELDDHLRSLKISHAEISDISALRGLPSLEKLEIHATPISDFSPLASLTNLKELKLNYCAKTPVVVPNLPQLQKLEITNTHGDIVLGDLPKLEEAKFQVLNDLSEVTRQPQLKVLSFQRIANSALEPFLAASNLRKLNIRLHGAMDLSPLASLSSLEQLYLIAPEVSDIAPIGKLTALKELEIHGAFVCNASSLQSLTNLAALRLGFKSPLDDVSFVSGMKKLCQLSLCPSLKADLKPLAELPHLIELGLIGIDPNRSLTSVTSCTALQRLFISTDKSVATRAIQRLPAPPHLVALTLSWDGLFGLDGLQGCHDLEKLYCRNANIENLAPLIGMKNLVHLDLTQTPISDLSVLATLPRFVAKDPSLQLSLKNTPALDRYPELVDTVAHEATRHAAHYRHKTALTAVRLVCAGDEPL